MFRWDCKVHNFASSPFLLIIIRSGRLAEIRWSVCMTKSHRGLCVSFFRTDAGLWKYHLFVWSNLNFLHNSQWITLPIQLGLVLYSFYANLLHSLIMWLIVSSVSLSILADLNKSLVLIPPLISNSANLFTSFWELLPAFQLQLVSLSLFVP